MQCSNNLKQIGLGLHNYENTYHRFPVGSIESNFISPFAAILPHLEEGNRYALYGFSRYYTSPNNAAISKQAIPAYLCPSMVLPRDVPELRGGEVGGPGSYLVNEGDQRLYVIQSSVRCMPKCSGTWLVRPKMRASSIVYYPSVRRH